MSAVAHSSFATSAGSPPATSSDLVQHMGHTRSGKRQKLEFTYTASNDPNSHTSRPSAAFSLPVASVSLSSRHRSDRPLHVPSVQFQIAEASQLQQPAAGLQASSGKSSSQRTGWVHQASRIIQRPGLLLTVIPKPVVLFGAGAVAGAIGKASALLSAINFCTGSGINAYICS